MYKVLLVDDEPYILNGLSRLIDWDSLGYAVCGLCGKSSAAVEAALASRPDLVIVDIEMPVMNGLELMERLRPELPDTRFIILSAYDLFEYARRAIELGAYHYLLKPIDADKLTALLTALSALFEKRRREEAYLREIADRVFRQNHILSVYLVREVFLGKTSQWDAEMERIYESIRDGFSYQLVLIRFYPQPAPDGLLSPHPESMERDVGVLQRQAGKLSFQFGDVLALVEEQVSPESLGRYYPLTENPVLIGYSERRTGLSDAHRFLVQVCGEFLQQSFFEGDETPAYCGREPGGGERSGQGVLFALREKRSARLTSCVFTLDGDAAKTELAEIGSIVRENCRSVPVGQIQGFFHGLFTEIQKNVRMMLEPDEREGDFPPLQAFLKLSRLTDLLRYGVLQTDAMIERLRACSGSREIVAEVKSYVKSHFKDRDLKLSVIADRYYINYSYLSYIFKKKTGVNFYSYLLDIRLSEAKRLLRSTALPVADVACLVGYPDSKNFHHLFKKHVGLSPNKYRGRPDAENVI